MCWGLFCGCPVLLGATKSLWRLCCESVPALCAYYVKKVSFASGAASFDCLLTGRPNDLDVKSIWWHQAFTSCDCDPLLGSASTSKCFAFHLLGSRPPAPHTRLQAADSLGEAYGKNLNKERVRQEIAAKVRSCLFLQCFQHIDLYIIACDFQSYFLTTCFNFRVQPFFELQQRS